MNVEVNTYEEALDKYIEKYDTGEGSLIQPSASLSYYDEYSDCWVLHNVNGRLAYVSSKSGKVWDI
jgi:hypothetical protein